MRTDVLQASYADESLSRPSDDGGGWGQRTAEERASAAGPAPAAASRLPPIPALRSLLRGVEVNPPGYKWEDTNFVAGAAVPALEKKWADWVGTAAGEEGAVLSRSDLDVWQKFAYDILSLRRRSVTRKG